MRIAKLLFLTLLITTLSCISATAQTPDTTTTPTTEPLRRVVIDTVIQAPGILRKANELLELGAESSAPIDIVLNSPGGGVYGGLQFVNAMKAMKARGITLRCHVVGMAASMAFIIYNECDERYALPYALLLWHPVRVGGCMTLTPQMAKEIAWDLEEIERLIVPNLIKELGIDEDTFMFHHLKETMWTAVGLREIAPLYLTVVDDMPIAGGFWHPGKMESTTDSGEEKDNSGAVKWDEFEISPYQPPTHTTVQPQTQDCQSCHKNGVPTPKKKKTQKTQRKGDTHE